MGQTKNKPKSDGKSKKRILASTKQIRKSTGRDPAKLPPKFVKILREELVPLHLPVATSTYPFESVRPGAIESEYIQTGMHCGDYLFDNIDYAV